MLGAGLHVVSSLSQLAAVTPLTRQQSVVANVLTNYKVVGKCPMLRVWISSTSHSSVTAVRDI